MQKVSAFVYVLYTYITCMATRYVIKATHPLYREIKNVKQLIAVISVLF